jgi:hypothetical protein
MNKVQEFNMSAHVIAKTTCESATNGMNEKEEKKIPSRAFLHFYVYSWAWKTKSKKNKLSTQL